jgi:hypothetical protein
MSVRPTRILLLGSLVACVPPPAATPVYVSANASASVGTPTPDDEAEQIPVSTAPSRSVIVLVDKHIDRPTEVVGVLDFHSAATSEDKGFDELRAHAAAMGADAVIGAEFEHGDGNEPSHLSGMAVRFLNP